jgi:hypothetical protein
MSDPKGHDPRAGHVQTRRSATTSRTSTAAAAPRAAGGACRDPRGRDGARQLRHAPRNEVVTGPGFDPDAIGPAMEAAGYP